MNERSMEQRRAQIAAIRAQLDWERRQRMTPAELNAHKAALPAWWVIAIVAVVALPFYAVYVVLWLAYKIFNAGTTNTWKGTRDS
jgi:cobalamin synthase